MADPVNEGSLPAQREEAVLVARRRAQEKVPRHRFGLAYLALAALLGAAVGLFVVLVGNGGKDRGAASWSAWKPTESGVKGLNQIAQHVSNQYALPSGRREAQAHARSIANTAPGVAPDHSPRRPGPGGR